MNSLGTYLRNVREENNLSLNAVYNVTGITDSRLSKLENNNYEEPSPVMLKKLANLYQLSIVDLFIRAGYMTYDDLNICPQIFHGIDQLTDEDIKHIQNQIDYIISKQQ